jgi:transposase InsO family protein
MSVKMNKSIEMERYQWILPIIEKRLTYAETLKICPHSKRSLERWVSAYKKFGLAGLIPESTAPKTQPNETPIRLKEEMISLRKKTGLCAQKLHWRLKKQGIHIHTRTVGKIIKKEGLVRKYRVKKIKYKYLQAERQPGELLEMDVKFVPGAILGLRYYQYTVIDTASRWRHLEVFDEQSTHHSIKMMEIVLKRFPYQIRGLKTDNHSTFTNYYLGTNKRSDVSVKTMHALDQWCAQHNIVHYLIDPGRPAQNGTVERSHREDQQKFYERNKFSSINDLKKKIRLWNEYYNNLEHCSLDGKTPNEVLYS